MQKITVRSMELEYHDKYKKDKGLAIFTLNNTYIIAIMKRISLLTAFLFMLSLSAFAQKDNYQPGTENYLLVKRGFKIFKLGEPIEKYSKYVKIMSEEGDDIYKVIDKNMLSVGKNIKIENIILTTYKGNILNIGVFVNRAYKDKFFSSLQEAYGKGTQENPFIESYIWTTNRNEILLSYKSNARGSQACALFLDGNLSYQQEKDKKKQAISNIDNL